MSTSVNTIKRLLWVLIGVLILTYLISLNMEDHFIALNAKWISNDFLFAVAGGTFASLVVVIVCEVIKYRQLKLATEAALFSYMGNLYGQFLIIRGNCKRSLNANAIVPDNLIQSSCDYSMMLLDNINGIDFTTFCNKSKINTVLTKFKTEKYLSLKNVLIGFTYLRIAICEDTKVLLQQEKHGVVTAKCPYTKVILNKIVSQTSTILTYLDQIITQIDDIFDNRYDWQRIMNTLNKYQNNYETKSLADYMNEDLVVF